MRAKVEKLFKLMIDEEGFPKDEEVVVYAVFVPQQGEISEESIEVSEQEIDLGDRESIKRFLERTTREALEAEVKGLKLYGYVFEDSDAELRMVAEESTHREVILRRIERMREDI
jgi:hypothetical protein